MGRRIVFMYVVLCSALFGNIFGTLKAQSLKTGFQSLEINDYFKAKKVFDKKKKKKSLAPIAALGLTKLYLRPQNVFQNIDSAYLNVVIAHHQFDAVKKRKQQKFAGYGFDKPYIDSVRQEVSTLFFNRAVEQNSEVAFVQFIQNHYWAKEVPKAIFFRDSLAYFDHLSRDFSEEMTLFLNKYPTSVFAQQALEAFFRLQFEEETQSKTKEAYERFIAEFPENPYTKEADTRLFRFAQDLNTEKGYEKFLERYPKSAHRNEAWRLLYRVYIKNNGLALINEFKKTYPNYPFMAELEQEQAMLNMRLFPLMRNKKWGFMDQNGQVKIQPKFDFVEFFSQGRAIAQVGELYGFIDVIGQWVIQPQFADVSPFRYNLSVVTDSKGKTGVINLFGETVIQPRFEDIQIINDDWLWVEDESGWILYQISKNKFGKQHYASVNDFEDGFAVVADDSGFALIDLQDNKLLAFPSEFERFGEYFLVNWNDSTAIVNELNDKILPYNTWTVGAVNTKDFTPFELNGFLGYLNEEGKIVIPARLDVFPNWELFAAFENGHAKAYQSKARKFGLIDQSGNWVVAAKYNDISFHSDIIAVQLTDKWEYISRNGVRLNIGLFDRAESFVDGAGIVIRNGLYGLINERGESLVPLEMRRMLRLNNQLLRWEDQSGKHWLGDNQGKKILDLGSDKIERIDDQIVRLIVDENVYYYLLKEKRLVFAQ